VVEIDPRYFRPAEVDHLLADISKANSILGWEPKVAFNELIKIMVDADMESAGINSPGDGRIILKDKNIDWTSN
jgi:GDPmannose 4,6-dehydratase